MLGSVNGWSHLIFDSMDGRSYMRFGSVDGRSHLMFGSVDWRLHLMFVSVDGRTHQMFGWVEGVLIGIDRSARQPSVVAIAERRTAAGKGRMGIALPGRGHWAAGPAGQAE